MDQTEFLPKPCETAAKTDGSRHRWLAAHPRSLEVANFTPNIDEGLKKELRLVWSGAWKEVLPLRNHLSQQLAHQRFRKHE